MLSLKLSGLGLCQQQPLFYENEFDFICSIRKYCTCHDLAMFTIDSGQRWDKRVVPLSPDEQDHGWLTSYCFTLKNPYMYLFQDLDTGN